MYNPQKGLHGVKLGFAGLVKMLEIEGQWNPLMYAHGTGRFSKTWGKLDL
jgi:hypothetical protein